MTLGARPKRTRERVVDAAAVLILNEVFVGGGWRGKVLGVIWLWLAYLTTPANQLESFLNTSINSSKKLSFFLFHL